MTIQHCIRISLTAAFIFIATFVLSQSTRGKEEPKGDLEILAAMDSPSVCLGTDYLGVRIMVTNKGGEPVDLDVSSLSTTAGFVALIDTTEMKFRSEALGISGDPIGHVKPARVLLPPKGFFEKEVRLPIRNAFFNHEGYYRLLLSSFVRVGQASRAHDVLSSDNAMIFELQTCESQ